MKFYTTSKISENIHQTPEGYLVCIGVAIARTGEMLYGRGETPLEVGPDGTITISREAREVFREETIASFEGKAVTIQHPVEFVDPDNWKTLTKGVIQNVRRGEGEQENDLIADLLITDAEAIKLVNSGLREVSCGYEAEYIQTGEGRGVQTNIIGNHLALVEEGRAGSSYAINDHKGKGDSFMKLKDKIKAIFGKAQDEALALVQDEAAEPAKKGEKKEEKAADAPMGASYDDLVNMVKDLGEKVAALKGGKDASSEQDPASGAPAKIEAKDDESPAESGLEARLKKLEDMVAKLMARESKEDEVPVSDEDGEEGEESEESEDEDMEESEDDDFEESTMTGDAASRIEILAPGLKVKGKDAKADALKAAYKTADGKKAIDALTGGKAPTFDSAEKVNTLFIAASELLKQSRTSELARTKTRDTGSSDKGSKAPRSAEDINEINAKHYGNK